MKEQKYSKEIEALLHDDFRKPGEKLTIEELQYLGKQLREAYRETRLQELMDGWDEDIK